jgi:truncated hemoglobin YjbI
LGSEPKFDEPSARPEGAVLRTAAKLVSDPNNPDQWLACMDQAMQETGVDPALRARLNTSFFQTADWMRNRVE